ncbi:MAG TPA: ABC transporter permease subunit [Acidilobales archaeon]|nr:ABC transporter permease subunit [Acidilobales archaeon]
MIFELNAEVLEITIRSIMISGGAVLLSSTWSLPLAYITSIKVRGELIPSILEALIGMPTVLLGLLLYFLLSSQGPLGFMRMLYTPQAIILGQALLITPLIIATSYRILRYSIETYGELALSLGASKGQAMIIAFRESIPGLLASLTMAFSRAIGELGIALIVGGNIKGYTRVLTTAIALEVSKGDFEKAVSLGMMLLLIMVVLALTIKSIRRLLT